MKYYVIKYGGVYLADWHEYWARWSMSIDDAMTFRTLEDATEIAELVDVEATVV